MKKVKQQWVEWRIEEKTFFYQNVNPLLENKQKTKKKENQISELKGQMNWSYFH